MSSGQISFSALSSISSWTNLQALQNIFSINCTSSTNFSQFPILIWGGGCLFPAPPGRLVYQDLKPNVALRQNNCPPLVEREGGEGLSFKMCSLVSAHLTWQSWQHWPCAQTASPFSVQVVALQQGFRHSYRQRRIKAESKYSWGRTKENGINTEQRVSEQIFCGSYRGRHSTIWTTWKTVRGK